MIGITSSNVYKLVYIELSRYAAGIQQCSHAAMQSCSRRTAMQIMYDGATNVQ